MKAIVETALCLCEVPREVKKADKVHDHRERDQRRDHFLCFSRYDVIKEMIYPGYKEVIESIKSLHVNILEELA